MVKIKKATSKKRKVPNGKKNNDECNSLGKFSNTEKLEDEYRMQINDQVYLLDDTKPLLPIKTKDGGIVSRRGEIVATKAKRRKAVGEDAVETAGEETTKPAENLAKPEVSTADMILERDEEIERQKFYIGVMCASILESPETKTKHLTTLLDLIAPTTQNGKVNMFVVRKMAMISLVEVFKDIVPEYRLGIIDTESQKLKKTTLARVNFENELLLQYKKFLVLMESLTQPVQRKHRSGRTKSLEELQLAEIAVQCMCDLLNAHPYFNYGMNVGQMLVTLLNSDVESVRQRVRTCFCTLFKSDTRLDLSKHIVRHLNQLVKKKEHNVHPEMVSCLKYLPIKDFNLNAVRESEIKKKKLEAHKSRVINMSRQERKRKKKLAELERELFETKAEESAQIKQKKLTDLTKLVFTIFFRILKIAPKSKLLSVTLEGLSKFAHTINIEFFSDLVEVLNNLLVHENLGCREQLHCIQTVFTVLRGQGEVLNIDPARFYTHLYKNLLSVHAGKSHDDLESILSTLDHVLMKRQINITYHRHLAFIKRLSMMSLHLLHFGTLGCLGVIRNGLIAKGSLDILLDTESSVGSGEYDPEVEEPEFSNASSASLYELSALHRHYHPCVRKFARNISGGVPTSGAGMLPPDLVKLAPHELYTTYDSSKMVFNPAIPVPKQKQTAVEGIRLYIFADHEFEKHCMRAQNMQQSDVSYDFFGDLLKA
ncbi:nucleolar complex protein 3 homolog [Toxorhynchites rutilus septentrionalis]|uniref:nucleolar complex protein 3 homolog n=1 Tax=Toxorhynchites rutilus septentrionalis TaxID=329112 RepID=UPI0024799EEA|nr:nucleolar complex protein 3 homolog [Toxorhynchites rutilus septentrionalis]